MGESVEELQRLVVELQAETAGLRREVAQLQAQARAEEPAALARVSSRRSLLRLLGAGVLAAGATAMTGARALATTGGNFLLGQANDAGATTSLTATTATNPQPVLFMYASGASASAPTFASLAVNGSATANSDAVLGSAPTANTGIGVHGLADAGYGVAGFSGTGVDLAGLGQGRLLLVANVTTGPPTFTPGQHEIVRDAGGALFVSRATGTGAAAWRQMNTVIPINPVRVIDTRASQGSVGGVTGPLAANTTYVFPAVGTFTGNNGIPTDALGLIGNLTPIAPGGSWPANGYVKIWPAGQSEPTAVAINFVMGTPYVSNLTIGTFGTGPNAGKLSIKVGGTAADIGFDVVAYIQ